MSEMSEDGDKTRPNIRIEIQNEKMEVDEGEEGEILDEDFDTAINVSLENNGNVISTNRSVFTTGINIFDENEQQKRQERAKRFALKPEEIHNFGEADVEKLYESLGITNETDSNIRFDAVHLRSTVELTAEIVLEYFAKYAPTSIEWIDEDCCNVLWLDNVTAARAIYYTSKAVRGMPAREQVSTFAKDFLEDDAEEEEAGRSILLKNRQVELKHDEIAQSSSKIDAKNSVDISEITIPIPPGYWRLGSKALKTKCVLLRFALRTDKKPYRIETLSKYYKTLSNTKGIIDEGKKNELRGIFERNRELNGKNPWGSLARDWDHDAKFREQIPHHHHLPDEPPVEVRNPSLLVRLGRKTAEAAPAEHETAAAAEEKSPSRSKTFPRMRMYADEEEEKMRRRRLLQTIQKQSDKLAGEDARPRDLRSVLSVPNHAAPPAVADAALGEDLGRRLKNRPKHMVYAVEGEPCERKENLRRADIRAVIERRRARSPDHDRQRLESRQRSRSPQRRRSASPRERRRRHHKEHTSHRTLHSDRMGARQRKRDSDDYSDDESFDQKPRSKVAVVIKTQKKPTVASTIWSRVQKREADSDDESDSSSDSESASEKSKSGSSSSESRSESESDSSSATVEERPRRVERPGFRNGGERIGRNAHLKISSSNDRYRR